MPLRSGSGPRRIRTVSAASSPGPAADQASVGPQPCQTFRVVAGHRITQRLALHARQPRRLGTRHSVQRVRDRQRPGRCLGLGSRRARPRSSADDRSDLINSAILFPQTKYGKPRQRKRDAVLRLLRGEDLEMVSRGLGMSEATLTSCRDAFVAAGEASLATRITNGEDLESERLKARLSEMLLKQEMLKVKILALEGDGPSARRRSRPWAAAFCLPAAGPTAWLGSARSGAQTGP